MEGVGRSSELLVDRTAFFVAFCALSFLGISKSDDVGAQCNNQLNQ